MKTVRQLDNGKMTLTDLAKKVNEIVEALPTYKVDGDNKASFVNEGYLELDLANPGGNDWLKYPAHQPFHISVASEADGVTLHMDNCGQVVEIHNCKLDNFDYKLTTAPDYISKDFSYSLWSTPGMSGFICSAYYTNLCSSLFSLGDLQTTVSSVQLTGSTEGASVSVSLLTHNWAAAASSYYMDGSSRVMHLKEEVTPYSYGFDGLDGNGAIARPKFDISADQIKTVLDNLSGLEFTTSYKDDHTQTETVRMLWPKSKPYDLGRVKYYSPEYKQLFDMHRKFSPVRSEADQLDVTSDFYFYHLQTPQTAYAKYTAVDKKPEILYFYDLLSAGEWIDYYMSTSYAGSDEGTITYALPVPSSYPKDFDWSITTEKTDYVKNPFSVGNSPLSEFFESEPASTVAGVWQHHDIPGQTSRGNDRWRFDDFKLSTDIAYDWQYPAYRQLTVNNDFSLKLAYINESHFTDSIFGQLVTTGGHKVVEQINRQWATTLGIATYHHNANYAYTHYEEPFTYTPMVTSSDMIWRVDYNYKPSNSPIYTSLTSAEYGADLIETMTMTNFMSYLFAKKKYSNKKGTFVSYLTGLADLTISDTYPFTQEDREAYSQLAKEVDGIYYGFFTVYIKVSKTAYTAGYSELDYELVPVPFNIRPETRTPKAVRKQWLYKDYYTHHDSTDITATELAAINLPGTQSENREKVCFIPMGYLYFETPTSELSGMSGFKFNQIPRTKLYIDINDF